MFRNYLKTAFRNLLREKSSTAINISGLTLGITCSLVLFILVSHLSSFDNYHKNLSRIYRVVTESDGNNGRFYTPGVPAVLPEAFKNDFHEAEEVTFLSYRAGSMITIPSDNGEVPKKYNEEAGVVFGQPNFFKVFDRKIITGSAEKGLDDPSEAIISQKLAKKYFGESDPIGQVVKYDTVEYKITAVMEDFPANTDFPFDLMLSYITIKQAKDQNGWNSIWSDEQCYILVKDESSAAAISSRMAAFVDKHLGKNNYEHETFTLQPLNEMHFDDRYETFTYATAPKEMLISLGVIAIFLVITACINFINLATAEAIKRSKEVGIRKSLGSTRLQLVAQFLGETTMVTVASMLVALGLAQIGLSLLNGFLDRQLSMDFSAGSNLWIFIVGITVLVSLLSGLYPSLVISGYRPVQALKNQITNKSSAGFNLRRGLVVLQFVISQGFIISTIVLIYQMNYFQKQDLGFAKDAILIVPIPVSEVPNGADGSSKMKTLRQEISTLPAVEDASLNSDAPASGNVSGTNFRLEGWAESDGKDTQVKQIDGNYLKLFDLKLIAGTNVEDFDTARGFIVNEQLVTVAKFDSPEDIIGKKIRMWGKTLPVVGVVKDFHTVSLRDEIEPTVLLNRIRGYRNMAIKVNPGQIQSVVEGIKTKWEAAYPEFIFEYHFLDERIKEFYEGEQRMSVLFTLFTSMAIFIGCLGLFGLATFMANQRTKEIGVRKVLGASAESIVLLFTKEFTKLIVIGFLIASPIAWWLMNQWLNGFAYKITIGPMIFVIGFSITIAIALLTVGYRSLKAAIINPVTALRYE